MDIDLHIHTHASDGSYSPTELATLARKRRLGAIAFTDHDTIDGIKAFLGSGATTDIPVLTGVEITAQAPADFDISESLHILGYGFRLDDDELNRLLLRLQEARDNRTPLIIEKLQQLGMDLTYEDLAVAFPGPQLGRPHIAQWMVQKAYVTTIDEAFDRYLSRGKPGYVDKMRAPCEQAIAAIRHAQGVAVLAHPVLYKLSDNRLETLIRDLKEKGLQGIEVYYPGHSEAQTTYYKALVARYGLLATGGTDYHGDATPGISLGVGRGDFHVPYELYEKLLQALQT